MADRCRSWTFGCTTSPTLGKRTCRIEPTPRRNRHKACHSCMVHLEAAELRSPPSHQLARLGPIRRRSTHGYLEYRFKSIWTRVKMSPTYEIVLNPSAASDFQIRAATFAHGEGGEQSSGSAGFKRNRQDDGTFELRRHHPALVIFVRVGLVGTWQESFDLLFEHFMPPQTNSAPAHTWQIA